MRCGKKGKLPKWLMENQGLDTLEKDKRVDSYMLTTCAIFNAWHNTKVAV